MMNERFREPGGQWTRWRVHRGGDKARRPCGRSACRGPSSQPSAKHSACRPPSS